MSKDRKDYLHLYLGCEVEFGYPDRKKKGELVGKTEPYGWQIFDPSNAIVPYHSVREELFKLVLRPLSDMTEEEQKELCLKMFPDCKEVKEIFEPTLSDGYGWSFECERGYRHYVSNHTYVPEAFLLMLSKHFDLFGLIESGLAIDKTKLNP